MSILTRLVAIPFSILYAILYAIIITIAGSIFLPLAYIRGGWFGVCAVWEAVLEVNYAFATAIGMIAQGRFSDAEKYLDKELPD